MADAPEKQELLDAIRKEGAAAVVKQYRHNLLSSRLLIELFNEVPEPEVLRFLALYPTVPSQVLQSLAEHHPDPALLAAVAANPRCTQNLLIKLAEEGSPAVRGALAENKLHSQRITGMLVRDPNLFVRSALAKNPALNPSYQTLLGHDTEPAVRTTIALRTKLPQDLALTLSHDSSPVVSAALHGLGKVEPKILQHWADSDDETIQQLLLTRSKLSLEAIRSLCHSPHALVKKQALEKYEPLSEELLAWAESEDTEERIRIAAQKDLPVEIQHILANDAQADVREALASNPAVHEDIALWIAGSNDPAAAAALAKNPSISAEVITELCHHEDPEIALRAAYHPNLTEMHLDILVNQREEPVFLEHLAFRNIVYPKISRAKLDGLSEHKRPSMRRFAAHAKELNNNQVKNLIRDASPAVRLALTENPILTEAALLELSKDWNKEVANAANRQLEQLSEEPQQSTEHDLEEENGQEQGLVSRIVRFFTD